MLPQHLVKAGLLTLVLVIAFVMCWEFFLRQKGYSVSYDDNAALWADKRKAVYQPTDKATVFIGSSRIKFDLDIPTWEKRTGQKAVQLAMVGSSPLPVLDHLAKDENFHGRLVISVTEGLFFSTRGREMPSEFIAFYDDWTPSQKASFQLNHLLESKFVFLDKDNFSINNYLSELPISERPGTYNGPDFPWEFDKTSFERQSLMDDRFMADTNLQKQVQNVWAGFAKRFRGGPTTGKTLDSIMLAIKQSVDKIKARGGEIIFVRPPSSGPYWQGENKAFPRNVYWDKLLAITKSPGIHFKDYPAISSFVCPEFSHLSPKDAIVFTEHFVRILNEKGLISGKQMALQTPHQN